MDLKN